MKGDTMTPSKAAMAKARTILSPPGTTTMVPHDVEDLVALVGRYEDRVARILQEHSDVAKKMQARCFEDSEWYGYLQSLILPDEPDPLAEAIAEMFAMDQGQDIDAVPAELDAANLRKALAKRGLKIVEADRDE